MKTELYKEKKLKLQSIHFGDRHSTDLGIVGIIVIGVIEKLG
jgi:hypothetical protein